MIWYKANEELPKEGKQLIVAYWNLYNKYDAEATFLCFRLGSNWMWRDGCTEDIRNTDRWAYIEPPED